MSWRIIQITKPCHLSVKNKQLSIELVDSDKVCIPLEDISVLILENKQISLNNALISELAEYDIVMFSCDGAHNPSWCYFPFHNHSRYSEIAWQQIEISEPLKKRIWQELVKTKILNQAQVLKALNKTNSQKLVEISKLVQSGDAKNSEAFAAGVYWKNLFENFIRSDESDLRNSALNYGYAIIRGCLARFLVGAGLLPCFGVHHANKLNQFNLVDDCIEPFRAFVDYKINLIDLSAETELTPLLKNQLVEILTENCLFDGQEITLLKACELMAISVAKVIKNKDVKFLSLPVLEKLPLFK